MPDLPHLDVPGALIAPARTALLVVDVQNDFAAPDGAVGLGGVDLSAVTLAVERMATLVSAARGAGVAIAFARVVTRPETDPLALRLWLERRGTPEEIACCRAGTPGAGQYRLEPEPGDIVVEKRLYSAFHGTDLADQLRAAGRDTLVMAGLTTDCCLLATALDAFHRDFHLLVASDACAAYDAALHRAALDILQRTCALLVATDAAVAAWQEYAR